MRHFHRWSAKVAISAAFFIVATPLFAQWQTPNHSVPIGRGAGTGFKSVGPGTSGIPLIGQGSSADPAFGTATVPGGGTGATSFSSGRALIGNGTSPITTGSFLSGSIGCDPKTQGAVGDGVTDDTAAFQACDSALSTLTGGRIIVSPGIYCIKSGPVVLNYTATTLEGVSEGVTLSACGTDNTLVKMTKGNQQVKNLTFLGKGSTGDTGSFGATTPVIVVEGSNCAQCLVENLYIDGGSSAINYNSAGEPFAYNVFAFNSYSTGIVYVYNSSLWMERVKLDQAWPISVPSFGATANAWASTTAYNVGDVVTSGGYLIQCKTAGTSGGSNPTLKNYGVDITDGSAVWRLAGRADGAALQLDTATSEVYGHHVDMTGATYNAVSFTNNFAGAAPRYFRCNHCNFGQTVSDGINLPIGGDVYITASIIGGGFVSGASAINMSSSWSGRFTIDGGAIYAGTYGILLNAGSYASISGVMIDATTAGIAANTSYFVVSGNSFTGSGTGIVTGVGAFDYFNIVNNICGSSITTCVSNNATGVNVTTTGNH